VPAVYFLSDYGTEDEFVGVVHAVLERRAPGLAVIDLAHHLPPFDVGPAADMLVRCAPHLGTGVVLAVVDPGVGTERRAVAIRVQGGTGGDPPPSSPPLSSAEAGQPNWLVGPDNGLLVPMAAALGGVDRLIVLDRPPGPRPGSGPTFDGRDVFAPAAAHLAQDGAPESLGRDADPASLVPAPAGDDGPGSPVVVARSSGPAVEASVAWVDRFGNVQLRLEAADLAGIGLVPGATVHVELSHPTPGTGTAPEGDSGGDRPTTDRWAPPARSLRARWVDAFGDLEPGELGLLIDGSGRIALVLDQASAASRLGLTGPGRAVRIAPSGARAG
jgi:S-adenosyl-L-methionine hydrolase (adenosine-forming)